MSTLSPVKLARIRRRLLSGDSDPEYLLHSGKIYLEQQPDDHEVLAGLADAAEKSGDYIFAGDCLAKLEEGADSEERIARRLDLLSRVGNLNACRELCRTSGSRISSDAGLLRLQQSAAGAGDFELTLEVAERRLKKNKRSAPHWLGLGTARAYLSDLDGARDAYREAIRLDPGLSLARFLLSSTQRWSEDDNNIEALGRTLQNTPADTLDWQRLAYSLAKEHEDCGHWDQAFDQYTEGAQSVRRGIRYSNEIEAQICSALQEFHERPGSDGAQAEHTPLFILGMPRTGSTLLERMLTGHGQIDSRGETHALLYTLKHVLGRPQATSTAFARMLTDSQQADWGAIGKQYLNFVEPRDSAARYFIDKRPQNVFLAGVILRALPQARIIYTDRNPMDTCFSNYKHLFNPGFFPYSYDWQECGGHYLLVREFASAWRERYPDRVHEVNYDELVADPQPVIDRTCRFLGLEAEPGCYAPEQNAAGISTASFSQAREPLYTSSSQHWRHFEHRLEDLREFFENRGVAI